MIDLELLSEYQAWRDDNEGLDRDVTPLAFQAYRRALDNEDKLDRIMRLEIPTFLSEDNPLEEWSNEYITEAENLLHQVTLIIGQGTEHDRND